jgi:hypothetical protein
VTDDQYQESEPQDPERVEPQETEGFRPQEPERAEPEVPVTQVLAPPVEAQDPADAPPAATRDGVSVAAFVVSLFGAGLVAIPLAIWGLVRTRAGRRRGRGFAVGALAMSALWAAIATAALLFLVSQSGTADLALSGEPEVTVTLATPTQTPTTSSTPSATASSSSKGPLAKAKRVYWENLKSGMCVVNPTSDPYNVKVVDCRAPHEEEVTARTTLTGPRKWPGDSAIEEAADTKCRASFATYVGIDYDSSQLDIDYFTADKQGWEDGGHRLICMAYDPNHETLTATLKGAGR